MRVLVVGEDGWVVWQKGNNETAGWVKTYTNTDVDPQTISGQGVAKNNSDSVIDSAIAAKTSGKVDVLYIMMVLTMMFTQISLLT